jgi:hypothetical protein
VKAPVNGKWETCGHPEGYHQWITENPWALKLQMPAKQTPEQDTQSEKDREFGMDDPGSYPPSESDD